MAWVLAVLIMVSGIFSCVSPTMAKSSLGTVTVSVEKFSIGQGYLIEPCLVKIQQGDTYADICQRVLKENGYDYKTDGGGGFYLSGIYGADPGGISIPSCIRNLPSQSGSGGEMVSPPDNSAVNEYEDGKGWLGEFSYNQMSGWMYSVGNDNGASFPGIGMDGYTPKDGDVFRLQFSVFGYGMDLQGYNSQTGETYYEVGNKTELTRKIAQINQDKEKWFKIEGCQETYDKAVKQLKKVNARQSDLDKALEALPEEEPIPPESISLSKDSLALKVGDTSQLLAEILPDNANQLVLNWQSSNSDIVSVDHNGLVTAKSAGEADITVTTQNGLQARCHVTVEERYIEELILNQDSVSLEKGETFALEVKSYKPQDATEPLEVSYKSSNTEVAFVDSSGLIAAVRSGTAVVTASTSHGASASCQITVGNARELADAILEKMKGLPAPGGVTEENSREIAAVWEEYHGLSEKARQYVQEDSPESVEKLETIYKEVQNILEKLKNVEKVEQLLTELPALSQLSPGDAQTVAEARAAYDCLSLEEQGKVDEELCAKLLNLERALQDMKQELEEVHNQIQALPEHVSLSDGSQILEAWEAFHSLEDELQAQLGEELIERMENAIQNLLSCVAQGAETDLSQISDIGEEAAQTFLAASNVYEKMDEGLQGEIGQETLDALETGRERLEELGHKSSIFQMEGPWYVALQITAGNVDSETEKAVEKTFSKLASILWTGTVQYLDIRSGETYEPEKALTLSANLSGIKATPENPAAALVTWGGKEPIKVKELDTEYDVPSSTLAFKTRQTGTVLILDNPVAATGLKVPTEATVGLGTTYTMEISYVPADAAWQKELKFKSSDSNIVEVDENGVLKGISPGKATVTVSLKADASIKAKCKVTVTDKANDLNRSPEDVLRETSSYMLSIDTNPTIGSEWFVLGLARSGKDLSDDYFTTYYNHVANYLEEQDGKLTNTVKYTEYSKMILVMTAIGKDARDVAGYNLFEKLADFTQITKQGFNGPIWALIALNAKEEYEIPKIEGVKEQTTEEKLIQYLLEGECSGGGWTLNGDTADSDITGMTLQALTPYYQKEGYENVTKAVNQALTVLSDMQNNTGGYSTMGVETSESAAQVLTGLCALGIDPQTDHRFIKNGHWLVENLLSYHIDNSGFLHVKGGSENNGGAEGGTVNGMATEQAYYALTAYQRLKNRQTSLYDMSDLDVQAGGKGDGTGTGIQQSEEENGSNTQTGNSSSSGAQASSGKTVVSASSSGKKAASASASGKSGSGKKATSAATVKKKDSSDTEDKGWSFAGEDYTLSGKSGSINSGTGDNTEGESQSQQAQFLQQNLPYLLCIVCGAIVLVLCICLLKNRKKK